MADIPSIRKGNDLTIRWTITRQGRMEDLSGRDIGVQLLDQFGKACTISWSVDLNVITIYYGGRNQSSLGTYALLLVENEGAVGMVTLDTQDAFRLVAHTSQEASGSAGNIDVNYVQLESDVNTPSNGLSAYELAVQEGYEGTQKDWVRMISEQIVTSKDVQFIGPAFFPGKNAVEYVEQHLTDRQKAIACENIGAVSEDDALISEDIDETARAIDPTVVIEAVRYTTQTLSDGQQAQARENIGAADAVTEKVILEKLKVIEKTDIGFVGNPDDLRTDSRETLVGAINEVDEHTDTNTDHIGDLEALATEAKDNLVDAINEINEKEGDLVGVINELHAEHGTLDDLTTTAKDTFVDAINELDAEIGDLEDFALFVRDATTLVEAINILALGAFRYIGEYSDIRAFRNAHSPSEVVADFVPCWAFIRSSYTYDTGQKVPAGTIVWAKDCDGGTSGHINWNLMCAWTEIGDVALLKTEARTDLVAAINEIAELCYEEEDINFRDGTDIDWND